MNSPCNMASTESENASISIVPKRFFTAHASDIEPLLIFSSRPERVGLIFVASTGGLETDEWNFDLEKKGR